MLYSHASKSFRRIISFFLNVLVITSMVLGSFSTVIAQNGSDGTAADSKPAAGSLGGVAAADMSGGDLAIRQGSSARYRATAGQPLRLNLDVAFPVEGASYTWTLLNPPGNGEAVLSPQGTSVSVAYTAKTGFSGMDLFAVQVSDGSGQKARIGVLVEVSARASYTGGRNPVDSAQRRPVVTTDHTGGVSAGAVSLAEVPYRPEGELDLPARPEEEVPHYLPPRVDLRNLPKTEDESFFDDSYGPDLTVELPVVVEETPERTFIAELVPADTYVGLVIDGPVEEENGFTWLAHLGLQNAITNLGINGTEYVKTEVNTYSDLFDQCATANDMCIGVGWYMTDYIVTAANTYSGVKFVILDSIPENPPANLRGVSFRSEEAAYLAGLLAIRMSGSNVVASIGGMEFSTVTAFTRGYRNGAQCSNFDARVLVDFINTFTDQELAAEMAQDMMNYGADVIFPVAGPAGNGALLEATGEGRWAIGVDVDQWVTTYDSGDVDGAEKLLTSVIKRIDSAVVESVEDLLAENFTSDTVSYGLLEDGVGLADYHDAVDAISQDVKDEIEALKAAIIADNSFVNDSCRNPQLGVNPEGDNVWGWNWPSFSNVTLTVGDDEFIDTQRTDEFGFVDFGYVGYDLPVGELLTMDNGEFHKEHNLQYLTVDDVNVDENTVEGHAAPDEFVWVYVCNDNGMTCDGDETQAEGDGYYIVDMDDVGFDIIPGSKVSAHRWDAEMDATVVSRQVPNPYIIVNLNDDYVYCAEFLPNTNIGLLINDVLVIEGTSDENGNLVFNNQDIQPGVKVSVTDGVTTKVLNPVSDMTITDVDADADTVSGTAPAGSQVDVLVVSDNSWSNQFWVTAGFDTSTTWVADLGGNGWDIQAGNFGWADIFDDDGDYTGVSWDYLEPTFDVDPDSDGVWGGGWPANSTITLTIGTDVFTSGSDGNGWVDFGQVPQDLQVGNTLTLSAGSYSKTHTILAFAVTGFDVDLDRVYGTAPENAPVGAWGCDDTQCLGTGGTAGGDGTWMVDLSGIWDIQPGSNGGAHVVDNDGDGTHSGWRIANPAFSVNPDSENVWGWDWLSEGEIDLTVTRGAAVVYSGTADIDSNGNFGTNTWPVDIQVGDEVAVSVEGGPAKSHVVLALTFDEYDEGSDSLRGTAPEGSQVKAWGCGDEGCEESEETFANEFNEYEAFFPNLDIKPGTSGSVWRSDDDGDNTEFGWGVPNPCFAVNPDDEGVWGWEWPADTELTITVVSKGSFTVDTDENGNFGTGAPGIDIEVDDVVQVEGGGVSKDHTVLWFTYSVDEGTDIVSGTAPTDSWVQVWARDNDSEYGTQVQTGGDGNWSFYFNDDDFYVDIKPGTEGSVGRWDDDGDGTEFYWRILNPSIAVNPENDTVWGWEWPADTDVTLTITGEGTYDGHTNGNGDFDFSDLGVDIVTGDEVNVSGGGTDKTHTVLELYDISFDEDNDTVSGFATAGEWVNVWACDYDNCNGIDWQAGPGGAFSADMTQIGIDIAPGTQGNVGRWDDDNDGTVINWRVPDPYFDVDPDGDNVWGNGWPLNSTITLTIDTHVYTSDSDGDGNVDFGQVPLDLQVGDTLTLSAGSYSKTHTILAFAVTGFDVDLDHVYGTAPANAHVGAWGCDDNHCEGADSDANESGDWMVDLSGIWDIQPGSNGGSHVVDEDGDGTHRGWRVPNPSFAVDPENDTAWCWDWPLNTEITLTIAGKGTFYTTSPVEAYDFGFYDLGVDIVTGDEVNVSGGGVSKDLTVMELHDISFDIDNDTVSGIATEGDWVNVWACDYDNCDGIDWQAGPGGVFTADMTQIDIDIAPGTNGHVGRWDDDGDGTVIDWRVANPTFSVNPENKNVWGDEWLGNTDVTLTIGTFTRTVTSQGDGHVEFGEIPLDLGVGDHLVVTDGVNIKDHTIMPFAITSVDEDTDIVTGTAPGDTWVDAWACDYNSYCEGNGVESEADGSWEIDLSDRWDIVKGTWGGAHAVDNDGDSTHLDWFIPNPRILVYPFENTVRGSDLTPGATASLTIGTYHDSATVDENWYVEFNTAPAHFDIVPGQTVVVADGTNTRSALVTNIAVTGFDKAGDLVYGTAAPNSAVLVGAFDEDQKSWGDWYTVDATGNWTADFSGIKDITEGTWGWLAQIDADGDYIVVDWEVLPDAPANDLLADAEVLPLNVSEPLALSLNTSSATTSVTDPALGACLDWRYNLADKGQASVWYRYVATQDGALVIDTRGSDYDTALAVYAGTPSTTSRIACNDDLSGSDMDSSLIATVRTGLTYYIEVVDTGFTQWKPEAGIQSMEVDVQEIPQTQAVGGELALNVELKNCYALTTSASPATGGTVTKAPAPNCLGTKYVENTNIVLTALPKTTTSFWKWSDNFTNNVYSFPITQNTTLEAKFLGLPGAVILSSPASGALLHTWDVTPITLKWAATAIPSVQYELQVAQDTAFTDDLHSEIVSNALPLQLIPGWLEDDNTYYWKVRGINAAGGAGAWSSVRNFRTAVQPPSWLGVYDDSDDLSAGDELHTNRPQFRWNAAPGATGYYIEISKNSNFTLKVTTGTLTGGANTAFTPTVNLPDGIDLYWRVRANSTTRGPSLYTNGPTFQVPAAPATPLLVSPANNYLTTDDTPLLNWSDVSGYPNYEWEIATDIGFNDTDIHQDGVTGLSEVAITIPLDAAKTYYWRVRAVNGALKSGWSAVRSLRSAIAPPELTAPGDGDTLQHLRPTLDWEPVDNAMGYTVQISRTNTLIPILVGTYTRTAAQTDYTPTVNLPANITLYWRVQTKSTAYGPSAWTDWRSMVMPNPPSVPLLLLPAANALVLPEAITRFDWRDSTVTGGAVIDHYQMAIFRTAQCTEDDWIRNENPLISEISFDSLPANKTYYWAVRAYNTEWDYSAWSACRVFRTALKAPTLTEPPDDTDPTHQLDTNRPTFTWQPVDGAVSYDIQISRNATFTSMVTSGTSTGTSWSPSVNLPYPVTTPLYWRVRANSTTNGPGAWSYQYPLPSTNYWAFTPGAPLPIPVLVAPSHGYLWTANDLDLTWNYTVPGGKILDGYLIQVARDSAFTDTVVNVGIDQDWPHLYYPLFEGGLETGRTYYWRVAASFKDDSYTGWSTARTLRVALPPPELIAPDDGVNPLHLRPTFDWEGVSGAMGYTLQIARNTNVKPTLVGTYTRTAAQTDYTPTKNLPANVPLYWRVQTKSTTFGPSAWSGWRMLDMPNPPSTPSLAAPANGATLTTRTPRLDWGNAILPAGETWGYYELQVSPFNTFTYLVLEKQVDGLITDSQYIVESGLLSGTYYWRVRALNAVGEYGAWSLVRSFKVNITPDILRVGTTTSISTLDPIYAGNGTEFSYLRSMYEGLTVLDENLGTIAGAASGWDYATDGLSLTFTLRPNLKYSDGSLLNAKRFEYAIRRFLDHGDATFAGYLDVIYDVEARDGSDVACSSYLQTDCLTLWVGLNQQAAYVPTLLSMALAYPVKEEKIVAGGAEWWALSANQVGNGAFKMSAFDADGKTMLLPNTYYRGGAPTYRLEYSYYADDAERLDAYRADSLDIVPFNFYQMDEVKADPALNEEKLLLNGFGTYAVMFDLTKEPFSDPYVRQAFALAIDREAFVHEVLNDSVHVNLSWIPPGFPGYDDEHTLWDYDAAAADLALAVSSYGDPTSVPPVEITYSSTPANDAMWNWLKTRWEAELGVTITLNPVDWDTFVEYRNNDKLQLFSGGWNADNPDPQNWLSEVWHSGVVYANRTHYANPAFDALLEQADSETDPAVRLQLYKDSQRMLIDDMPLIPLYSTMSKYLVKPWVQGLLPSALDYTWVGEYVPLAVNIQ